MKHIRFILFTACVATTIVNAAEQPQSLEQGAEQAFRQMQQISKAQGQAQYYPSILPQEIQQKLLQYRRGYTALELLTEQTKLEWIKCLIPLIRKQDPATLSAVHVIGQILRMKDFKSIANDLGNLLSILELFLKAYSKIEHREYWEIIIALTLEAPGLDNWLITKFKEASKNNALSKEIVEGIITSSYSLEDSIKTLRIAIQAGISPDLVIDMPDTSDTLLTWAIKVQAWELIRFLISAGANVNLADQWQQTPLYWAKRLSLDHPVDREIIQLLIKAGAKE